MTRQLSQASYISIVANASSPGEVASIARANIGVSWTTNGCTDFVWGVSYLAGRPFFDPRGVKNLVDGAPLQPADINYVVPHEIHSSNGWATDQTKPEDGWSVISHGNTA